MATTALLAVAEKIRSRLSAPYAVDGGPVTITASIGTAVYPVDGQEYGALMEHSDIGMYRAKTRSSAPPNPEPLTTHEACARWRRAKSARRSAERHEAGTVIIVQRGRSTLTAGPSPARAVTPRLVESR